MAIHVTPITFIGAAALLSGVALVCRAVFRRVVRGR